MAAYRSMTVKQENELLRKLLADPTYLRAAADYYCHGHLSCASRLAAAEGGLHDELFKARLASPYIHPRFDLTKKRVAEHT